MTVLFLPGEIPDLFSEAEIEGIMSGLRAEVRATGLLDSKENCWRFFTDRVRQQLTVWSYKVSTSSDYIVSDLIMEPVICYLTVMS